MIFLDDVLAQTQVIEWANLSKYSGENQALKKSPTVVFLGNSITEGWVKEMPDFFNQNNYVGRGISGQVSAQLLLRFRQDVLDLKPKKLIINIGTNDIAENAGSYNQAFTIGNIESMIQLAKANKIKVIVASVLPAQSFYWRQSVTDVPQKVKALNQALQLLAAKYKITYLDYYSPLVDSKGGLPIEMAEDGIHPNLACFKIMADLAKAALK